MANCLPSQPYDTKTVPTYELRALYLLRNNIAGLLTVRRANQTDLAFALGKDKSWINKFLNGTREIQLKDLDAIASFFGCATYQLFQPGAAHITERRSGKDRRTGYDRRISQRDRQRARLDDDSIRNAVSYAHRAERELTHRLNAGTDSKRTKAPREKKKAQ